MARTNRAIGMCAAVVALQWATSESLAGQVPNFDPLDTQASFATMADYLARDGGRWRGTNPNFDGSPNSPPEFGLWFTKQVGGRVLQLQIVVHYADSTVVSSAGQWTFHPGTRDVRYVMTDRRGGVSEGVTSFPDAETYVTLATSYGRRGRTTEHKDDNLLVSDSLHRNETFRRENGAWVSGGVYDWRREGR